MANTKANPTQSDGVKSERKRIPILDTLPRLTEPSVEDLAKLSAPPKDTIRWADVKQTWKELKSSS